MHEMYFTAFIIALRLKCSVFGKLYCKIENDKYISTLDLIEF